jgi:predicted O-methyltransferase YrrM
VGDGAALLETLSEQRQRFDLIFADSWPGKFTHLDLALSVLAPGGFYVVDDLLPQPNWPAEHAPRVPAFMAALEQHAELRLTRLAWSTGLIVAARRG